MKFTRGYKNIRLPNYDYQNGWFFVTNNTDFGKFYLTGKIHDLVKRELETLNERFDGVSLDYATIVPSHIHSILTFVEASLPLSEVWRRFKAQTTLKAKELGFSGKSLWQRNYYEHVIRNEKALERIRDYIRNNPLKEELPLNEIYGDNFRMP